MTDKTNPNSTIHENVSDYLFDEDDVFIDAKKYK